MLTASAIITRGNHARCFNGTPGASSRETRPTHWLGNPRNALAPQGRTGLATHKTPPAITGEVSQFPRVGEKPSHGISSPRAQWLLKTHNSGLSTFQRKGIASKINHGRFI
ncbi:hypothetical protein DP116_08510 [Brasilonema bromeliae SPC951]|uniref:Uncharacterized protein n=1 Tax=Brasilonema bromeliae SPC951 TaxID=385972 RepID=A0ABX1P732_9CYAN|nr:hypothetical protein [Brasilonema bromeliae SPC951]